MKELIKFLKKSILYLQIFLNKKIKIIKTLQTLYFNWNKISIPLDYLKKINLKD